MSGCFPNQHSKEFLCSFLLKNGITHQKICLWWCVVVSCISHASGKVLPGVVKFYREIFCKSRFFKHIETASSEITKKQPVIFNTIAGWEHHCISYRIVSNFSCVCYRLQSSLSQSSSVLIFAGMKWKCYSMSVKRVMLILLGLIFPGLERGISVNHKISAAWKNRFYHKCLTAVIFGANIHYFEFLSFDIFLVSKLMCDF